MDTVIAKPPDSLGKAFIPVQYLPHDKDEYYLRNIQVGRPLDSWRHLSSAEVEILVKNGNRADSWDQILVTDPFDPVQVRNSQFFGLVRIGRLPHLVLEHHDLQVRTGITNSTIVACDIGDDVAIHNCRYLAHYIIGNRCILLNIDEMHTTDHAKFGNGIIKDGEPEEVRVWMDLVNERGGRSVMPFEGMIPADAYLWAKYRDDQALQIKLREITQGRFDSRRGYYGTVGDQCVIKNCQIIKDVKIGSHCYIKGANKLKNLTIQSSQAEPTQIGEGVELVNGIIGLGCRIFYGCKAVRFILGHNSNLKYGARLIHSFLGDNSTVSCCEILNSLIFPAHEQHHNNSFLIAACVQGQSNLAAGATIGSNHNSRSNDNEVLAGRGFWPGLCTSVKHPCRFASFVLLAKGDYPAELNIPLPFSLLNNNVAKDQLEVMPAYWWLYNMYALVRNSCKFRQRDKRHTTTQHIEFDYLAPDTIEEILTARGLVELWVGRAYAKANGQQDMKMGLEQMASSGKEVLGKRQQTPPDLEVLAEGMERSSRRQVLLRPFEGYHAYGQMALYYAVKNLVQYLLANPQATFSSMANALAGKHQKNWVNLGGQLVPEPEVDRLRADIAEGRLVSWEQIHARYDLLWKDYPLAKQRHAWATLCELLGQEGLTRQQWLDALDQARSIQQLICSRAYESRKKDFDNPFRQATYRNMEEMIATVGTVEHDTFVVQIRKETKEFIELIDKVKDR